MAGTDYRIEVIESAPFAENAYLLWRARAGPRRWWSIPASTTDLILGWLDRQALNLVAAILNTHGHMPTISPGTRLILEIFPATPRLIIGAKTTHTLLLRPRRQPQRRVRDGRSPARRPTRTVDRRGDPGCWPGF